MSRYGIATASGLTNSIDASYPSYVLVASGEFSYSGSTKGYTQNSSYRNYGAWYFKAQSLVLPKFVTVSVDFRQALVFIYDSGGRAVAVGSDGRDVTNYYDPKQTESTITFDFFYVGSNTATSRYSNSVSGTFRVLVFYPLPDGYPQPKYGIQIKTAGGKDGFNTRLMPLNVVDLLPTPMQSTTDPAAINPTVTSPYADPSKKVAALTQFAGFCKKGGNSSGYEVTGWAQTHARGGGISVSSFYVGNVIGSSQNRIATVGGVGSIPIIHTDDYF